MNRKKAEELLRKYAQGLCTPEEKALVERWYHKLLDKEGYPVMQKDPLGQQMEILDNLIGNLPSGPRQKKPVAKWLYAAAVLFIVGFGVYYGLASRQTIRNHPNLADIQPGTNKATLILANGKKIDLNHQKEGIIIQSKAIKYSDGSNLDHTAGAEFPAEPHELTLITPRGGQYQVILEDGTRVWLNAASTLRYPSAFNGGSRIVEIEGEAYFSVSRGRAGKDSMEPFIVKSKGQEIRVLGTEFNVHAFEDEPFIKTTLVNGAIHITRRKGPQTGILDMLLKPGEQSVLSATGSFSKQQVDPESVSAWKSGIFSFRNTPFDDMMRQIARWYDIDVIYQGDVPKESLSGSMERNVSLRTLMELFSGSGYEFRLEGRELTIENNNKE